MKKIKELFLILKDCCSEYQIFAETEKRGAIITLHFKKNII